MFVDEVVAVNRRYEELKVDGRHTMYAHCIRNLDAIFNLKDKTGKICKTDCNWPG